MSLRSVSTTLLRDPVVRFLLAGGTLFVLFDMVAGSSAELDSRKIVVSSDRIAMLAEDFARQSGSRPDEAELLVLIDRHVREEVSYREALALGLDRGDLVIRRRLQQKLEFLLEDMQASVEPTDAELKAYLQENPEDFVAPPRLSFTQVFISPGNHEIAASRAVEIRDTLQRGESHDDLGDATILPRRMAGSTLTSIASTFGSRFAQELERTATGVWTGPVESEFGLHVVFVDEKTAGGQPPFNEIREGLRYAVLQQRRAAGLEKLYEELLSQYEISIDLPDTSDTEAYR